MLNIMSLLIFIFVVIAVQIDEVVDEENYEDGYVDEELHGAMSTVTTPDRFPFMVYLVELQEINLFCSGVIVQPQWVLTSAKCLTNSRDGDIVEILSNQIYITAGTPDGAYLRSGHQVRDAISIYVHDLFDFVTGTYNIALIQANKPFSFNLQVSAVPLGTHEMLGETPPSQFYQSCTLVAYGLGAINSATSPFKLMHMNLQLMSEGECSEMQDYFPNIPSDELMCAQNAELYKWNLNDTGGGAMLLCGKKNLQLHGILLWKVNYNENEKEIQHKNQPELFTRINEYDDWLKTVTAYDTCDIVHVRTLITDESNLALQVDDYLLLYSFFVSLMSM